MNPKLAEEYLEAAQAEAASAAIIKAHCESTEFMPRVKRTMIRRAFEQAEDRGRRLQAVRGRVETAIKRDASPKRTNDPTLDLVYTRNGPPLPEEHVANLLKSVREKTLGERLEKYFNSRPVPKYALGYVQDSIFIGAVRITATPALFFDNIKSLLPAFAGTPTLEIIRSIYRVHHDPLPSVFLAFARGSILDMAPVLHLQSETLESYCKRAESGDF